MNTINAAETIRDHLFPMLEAIVIVTNQTIQSTSTEQLNCISRQLTAAYMQGFQDALKEMEHRLTKT